MVFRVKFSRFHGGQMVPPGSRTLLVVPECPKTFQNRSFWQIPGLGPGPLARSLARAYWALCGPSTEPLAKSPSAILSRIHSLASAQWSSRRALAMDANGAPWVSAGDARRAVAGPQIPLNRARVGPLRENRTLLAHKGPIGFGQALCLGAWLL